MPSDAALAHSRALSRRIVARIEECGGWIDFARYMELALYEPALGYYMGGAHKLGPQGDFVTAPELTPLFSLTLARQIGETQAEIGGDVVELGAGSGRLAFDLLNALAEAGRLPQRYRILEVSPDLRLRQRELLQRLPVELCGRVEWLDTLPAHIEGIVIANEVLDALPVHLAVWQDERVFERGVGWDGAALSYVDRPLSAGELARRVHALTIEAPYVSEISLRGPALVRTLARRMRRGALLFIDYGFGAGEYYHPQRREGTLMCHYRHRAHHDPFYLPGLQDITAHVDFSAAAHAGASSGLALLGYVNQASFLINLGITDLLAPGSAPVDYAKQAAAAQKLLSPAEMGELFKVLALGRETPAMSGFNRGDLSRLL